MIDRLRRDPGFALLAVAIAATVALYAPTIGRGLVNDDDYWLVRDNTVVRDLSWTSVRTMFCELDPDKRFVLTPEYLPVRDLSVMFDYAIWGDWYGGFHLTNLLVYIGAIALWFAALTRFGVDRTIAGVAILLWALHPSHAESVAWLSERKGLLGMLFAGTCALGYARYRSGGRAAWLALAVVAAPCAVWSKALAAFAIASLAVLELALPERRASWRRSLVGLAAIAVAGGLAFVPVLVLAKASAVVGTTMRAPASRIAMAIGSHGFYLRLASGAVTNAVSYPISTDGPSTLELVVGGVALAGIAAAAWWWRRWRPELRAAAAMWLLGWLPVSHLVLPLQMVFVADRYMLVPTLGAMLALAVAALRVPRFRAVLIAAIAVGFALRTLDAQAGWRDSQALWQRAVASNPRDADAWSMYAQAVAEAGDDAAARDIVARGLDAVRAPRLVLRAAVLDLAAGRRAEASALLHEAAAGGEPRAMTDVAVLELDDGKLDDALVWARQAVAAAPRYPNGQRILGKVALAAGRADEAFVAFAHAYELEPGALANRFNLALALVALHRGAEARPHLEACLADPALAARARAVLATLP